MSVDLTRFNFTGGENAAPIQDLTALPAADRERLVLAGIDVQDRNVSGTFMQLNHADVHCGTRHEGLELLDIRAALKKYDGLPQHYWRLLDPEKDEITRMTHAHCNGGYFMRVAKGVKLSEPVQSCMFIKGENAGQSIHNIVIVEEGAELHVLGGCATAHDARHSAHLGITEYYVEKGGKLTFTMIHNWGESTTVRPRSAGRVEADGVFQNNYILLKPVGDLQMYPGITLAGDGAVARFDSVIVAPEGSHVDSGNRIELNAPRTRGEIISRAVTTGGTIINRGFIGAGATPVKGHLECKGLILGNGRMHAIPELDSNQDGVELSHEAAVGKIAQEEIEYLMARGLDEDEAAATIVRGFLNVDIMGLPAPLKQAMDEQIRLLQCHNAM
ncbi:SufD family Fe-S cluster assembly protein [uncultured Desulfovibrio sp.]|uniref:SufD family Fe-S cluster assembly protein n=1 Tax=Candidatus Desulfovibrio intestinavium TaxID=2838534 RepID=A0A9D2HNQ6_9BACT|nr:SufD family Fe-S cluster assembly protein [uncultured Desulfovibrio sp.]HJA79522.1 SufD family Fe-S cluster assembly protein [Candidatus Desulfovibrio intestinavium]